MAGMREYTDLMAGNAKLFVGISLKVVIPAPSTTVDLKISGSGTITGEWGDGVTINQFLITMRISLGIVGGLTTVYASTNLTRTYTKAGTYIITIRGSIRTLQVTAGQAFIQEVIQWNPPYYIGVAASLYNCTGLTTIAPSCRLSETTTTCKEMFRNCSSLESVPSKFMIPDEVLTCEMMFSGALLNNVYSPLFGPGSKTTNTASMFYGCKFASLPEGFRLPPGLLNGRSMFSICTNLEHLPAELTLPIHLQDAYGMFANCSSLTSLPDGLTLPSGVTTSAYMFTNCGSLTALPSGFSLPSGLKYSSAMFAGCSALSDLPPGVLLPYGLLDCNTMFSRCEELTALPVGFTIPSTVTSCYRMLAYCFKLTALPAGFSIPDGITNLTAFLAYCFKLTALPEGFSIPAGTTNLTSFLAYCSSLTALPSSLTIPASAENLSLMFYDTPLNHIPDTLWPSGGFTASSIDVGNMFARTSPTSGKPTGFIPSALFWDSDRTFTNTSTAFTNCVGLYNYAEDWTDPATNITHTKIPASWGGAPE